MQLEKLSDDNWKLPEQEVALEFVVTVPVEIASLNVTATVEATATSEELSVVLSEETIGLIVSAAPSFSKSLASPYSLVSEQVLRKTADSIKTVVKKRVIFSDCDILTALCVIVLEKFAHFT